jgi:BASS family bile acid:Na+ symporter
MIPSKDWGMLAVNFASILVSIALPAAGAPFRPYTMHFMMLLLLVSFTSIPIEALFSVFRGYAPRICWFIFLKLILLPAGAYLLFRALWPDYALAALLLSGISTGVTSPFFSGMLAANTPLVILMVVTSSILVPFTLPPLVEVFAGRTLDISLQAMAAMLAQVIFVPLVCAELLRRFAPTVAESLSRRRYSLSLALFVAINLGVFSEYADFFRNEPRAVLLALAVGFVLAGIYFAVGMLLAVRLNPADQLSTLLSFGIVNNMLVVVFSARFFGPLEPTVAAVYAVPFFSFYILVRLYANLLEARSRVARAG